MVGGSFKVVSMSKREVSAERGSVKGSETRLKAAASLIRPNSDSKIGKVGGLRTVLDLGRFGGVGVSS